MRTRSVLFLPGSNPRAIEKARRLPADVVVFDLEDAVAPDAKAEARELVMAAVAEGGFGDRDLFVRVNGSDTPWFDDDLKALEEVNGLGVLLPKAECPDRVLAVRARIPRGVPFWVMIETPLGVLRSAEIAALKGGPDALVVGTNDLSKELGAKLTLSRANIRMALQSVVLAARAHGRLVIDGVYNQYDDAEGCGQQAAAGRDMGFDGKSAIHPSQLEVINAAYTPSADDIAHAEAVIAAMAKAKEAGDGVASLNGKMLEELDAERARRILTTAETA